MIESRDPPRRPESGLHPLLGVSEEGMVLIAADGAILLCNAAAEHILGLTLAELAARSELGAVELVREDGSPVPRPERPSALTLRTGLPCDGVRLGLRRSGGKVTWLLLRTRPLIRREGAAPWGVVAAFRSLPGGELGGPAAGAAAGEVVWELDLVRGEMRTEPSMAEALGLQALHRPAQWVELVAPEDREALDRAWRSLADGQASVIDLECRMRTVSDGWRWVRIRSRVIERQADGAPTLLAGTLSDVTRQRALEAQLSATERLASIGTLAAGVAHEVNNPLAWISGNLGYVLEHLGQPDADVPELRRALEEAQEGVSRVSDIVRRLRAFGQPTPGPARARVRVAEEVDEALALCRHEVSHRARLVVDVAAELPLVVLGPHELSQILVHLLRNAAQAIPEGRTQAHQVSVRARAEGTEVVLEVRDTGGGISPEVRPRIFDPFFSTRSSREGTGLGLSVCHGIVSAAGGRIEVESRVGQGSCFRVVLPAFAEVSPVKPPPPPETTRRRVLVVEDEPLVGRAVTRMLETRHDVVVVATAGEALARLEGGERYHLVLCDLMLPDTTGVELFERLSATVPAVLERLTFMTGGAFTEDAQRFLETHRVPTLTKPLDSAMLLRRIAAAPELG
jgi:signal transduction histidine kinase/CheY-like chemotaxis protein